MEKVSFSNDKRLINKYYDSTESEDETNYQKLRQKTKSELYDPYPKVENDSSDDNIIEGYKRKNKERKEQLLREYSTHQP